MRFSLLPTVLLSATPLLALPSSSFPTTTTPLLAFSHPKPFLGLDDGFSDPRIGHVAFIPGFHACGTLSIYSVEPGVDEGDWGLLPRGGNGTNGVEGEAEKEKRDGEAGEKGLWERYEQSATKVIDTAAVEGVILAWAKGT
jgi:hypothetical protein